MKKVKYPLSFILLMLLLASCNDEVKSLQYRVTDLEKVLGQITSELSELKDEIKSNTQFEKEMQCQEMLDKLKKRWNNVVGCYYSPIYNTCVVKYKMNGEIKESKIEDMTDSD